MSGKLKRKVDYIKLRELRQRNVLVKEIAKIMEIGEGTVRNNLKKMGIPYEKKIPPEVYQKRARSCGILSREFLDYFDGLIMSDGYLRPLKSSLISCYKQNCVEREWLDLIRDEFLKVGIEGRISLDKRENKYRKGVCYVYETLHYKELGEQRSRWYQNGKKTIPSDINFSSSVLWNNFVCGDGYYSGTDLMLGLDKYGKDQVIWVKDKLKSLGYVFEEYFVGISGDGQEKWRLHINVVNGVDSFYLFIGRPRVSNFDYKWPKIGQERFPQKSNRGRKW